MNACGVILLAQQVNSQNNAFVNVCVFDFLGFTDHFYILHQNVYYLRSKLNILIIFEKRISRAFQ